MFEQLWGPNGVIALGAIISIVGTIWAANQDSAVQTELARKSDEIAVLTQKNSDLIVKEALAAATGGDSWVYLEPQLNKDQKTLFLTFRFVGQYPLLDVVLWKNEQRMIVKSPTEFEFKGSNLIKEPKYTLYPFMSPSNYGTVDLSMLENARDGIHLEYSFFSRNGQVHQDIYVRKEGDHWSLAYKVIHEMVDIESKPFGRRTRSLIKKVDPTFPIHELRNSGSGPGTWTYNDFEATK